MGADRRAERQTALRRVAAESGLDTLLVSHLPNIRYLTGFTGSAGLVLVLPTRVVLLTDFRYETQAAVEVGVAAELQIDRVSVWDRLKRLLADDPPEALGFESQAMTVRDQQRLGTLYRGALVPTADLVERLRMVKDPGEVEAIRAAASLAHEALAEVLPTVRTGQTENAIGARLEHALRLRGSEWHPFPTIVASGPRSSLPHARTSDRPVGRGEWLLIDFGAQVGGYCADITRTVVVGAPADDRQRAMYELVREAQQRARRHLRSGITGREGDALARDLIAARGFGDAFGHSLGHGLGLEVHEAPRLAMTSDTLLPAGAVVTVEPGVYFSGWGGVRIEDDVVLGPDSAECLTDGRTELIELT